MEQTTSHRGEIIIQDIRSVATTSLFAGVSILLTEVINLVPNWDLSDGWQAIAIVVLTFLLDLAKKYAKVTNY